MEGRTTGEVVLRNLIDQISSAATQDPRIRSHLLAKLREGGLFQEEPASRTAKRQRVHDRLSRSPSPSTRPDEGSSDDVAQSHHALDTYRPLGHHIPPSQSERDARRVACKHGRIFSSASHSRMTTDQVKDAINRAHEQLLSAANTSRHSMIVGGDSDLDCLIRETFTSSSASVIGIAPPRSAAFRYIRGHALSDDEEITIASLLSRLVSLRWNDTSDFSPPPVLPAIQSVIIVHDRVVILDTESSTSRDKGGRDWLLRLCECRKTKLCDVDATWTIWSFKAGTESCREWGILSIHPTAKIVHTYGGTKPPSHSALLPGCVSDSRSEWAITHVSLVSPVWSAAKLGLVLETGKEIDNQAATSQTEKYCLSSVLSIYEAAVLQRQNVEEPLSSTFLQKVSSPSIALRAQQQISSVIEAIDETSAFWQTEISRGDAS